MRWLVLLLLLPAAAGAPMLTAVAPDLPGPGPGDELIAIGVPPWQPPMEMRGARLTDGEGTWTIPDMRLEPGQEVWFAADAAVAAQFGVHATHSWGDALRLGNDGDDLRLLLGEEVDAFAWGDKTTLGMTGSIDTTSAGLVYRRHAWQDTDHWSDWATPRMHRVGESQIAPAVLTADSALLYRSPDNAFAVLTDLIDRATDRLHLHVYDLRSQLLGDHLASAASRGVDVRILVEDRPVGQEAQDRHETAMILDRIVQAGGHATIAGSGRYHHHHLKVLVADNEVAIQTENWVASGVPADPTWGNRGWGLVLSGEPADWMADWMADDRTAWDSMPFALDTYDPLFEPVGRFPVPRGSHVPEPVVAIAGPVPVRILVSPDHTANPATEATTQAAREARERLLVQQLDLRTWASNPLGFRAPDPLYRALVDAPAPDKRVLAAAPFRHDDTGNQEVLASLAQDGVQGREMDNLHAKAFVADDTLVIGSMNGNHASRSRNREVTVMLESPALADAFAATFERDWAGGQRDWSVVWDDLEAPAPGPMLFGLALLVASCFTGRRGSHSR